MRAIPARQQAAWHMAQHSQLVYMVQPLRSGVPSRRQASRMAAISACQVGSHSGSTRACPSPTIAPSRTITAPNGPPICSSSATWRASAMARRRNVSWVGCSMSVLLATARCPGQHPPPRYARGRMLVCSAAGSAGGGTKPRPDAWHGRPAAPRRSVTGGNRGSITEGTATGRGGLRGGLGRAQDEAVAEAAVRADVARVVGIVAQLLAQAAHVDAQVVDLVHVLA